MTKKIIFRDVGRLEIKTIIVTFELLLWRFGYFQTLKHRPDALEFYSTVHDDIPLLPF